MRIAKTFFLLPSWTHSAYLPALKRSEQAHWSEIEVTSSTPSIGELYAFYPELATLNATGVSDTGEVQVVDIEQQAGTVTVRLAAGALAVVAYFSIGDIGKSQWSSAIKACQENGIYDFDCYGGAIAAGGAHILVGLGGYAKGREFLVYFFREGALQAAGLGGAANNLVERASCNANQKKFSTKYAFSGNYGLKLGAKDNCYSPDGPELGYAQALFSMLGKKMQQLGNQQGKYSKDVQFTMYDKSSGLVLGRFHLQLETASVKACPIPITGGDSCIAPGA